MILDYFLKKRIIPNCYRGPYLTRWYLLRTVPVAIWLHQFHASDEDRAKHDHPFSFLTIILWRGYIEHTDSGASRKWPGQVLYRPAEWKHRVELVDNKTCWTLVVRFKRHRDWGFWEPTGWVKWNVWLKNNCGEE